MGMDLSEPVEVLKGIGEKKAELLRRCGILTVRDFFYTLPRDYEDYQAPTSIVAIRPGKIVIKGKIDSLSSRRTRRRNLSITEGVVRDKTGAIKVIWFNQKYRMKQFSPEKEYYFTGNYEFRQGRYTLVSPSAAEVTDVDMATGLSPVYLILSLSMALYGPRWHLEYKKKKKKSLYIRFLGRVKKTHFAIL